MVNITKTPPAKRRKRIKKSNIAFNYFGALLIIVSSFFDWYMYPDSISSLGRIGAHNIVLACGILIFAFNYFIEEKESYSSAIFALLLPLIVLVVMSQNHISQAPLIEEVGIGMSNLYYVGLVGVLFTISGSSIQLAKVAKK